MTSAKGPVASANNRPHGWVFLQDARIRLPDALIASFPKASLRDLAEIQLDVGFLVAVEFLASAEADLRALPLQAPPDQQVHETLLAWGGAYHADTEAPANLESFIAALVPLTDEAFGGGGELQPMLPAAAFRSFQPRILPSSRPRRARRCWPVRSPRSHRR
jgi:hypothetical protein